MRRLVEEGAEPGVSSPPRLLYFQITRHLRNAGLAHRGLHRLAEQISGIAPVERESSLPGIPAEVWNAFRNLFLAAVPRAGE